jgi:predicted transcriptional regulator
MGLEFPAPKWAVPGVLAEGLNLLVGPPKLGKSWLALNVAVAIAAGGKALGTIDVDQGDVLYLALEDTGRRLQSRLRAILGEGPAPERLTLTTACETLYKGGQARICGWLDGHPDARLVIVDVFTKVRGHTDDKSNRYESDYLAVSALKTIADEYGIAMLLIHHTRKAESTDFVDAVSGTAGIAGAADAVLLLTRSRGSASGLLKITGRDVEEADHALAFDSATGTWKLLAGIASDWTLADTRRRVLAAVRDEGPMTPKTLAVRLGIAPATIRQTCGRMADDGQLDTDGNGHYSEPLSAVTGVTPVTQTDISAGQSTDRESDSRVTPRPPLSLHLSH